MKKSILCFVSILSFLVAFFTFKTNAESKAPTKNTIPIAMATDRNYVYPTIVAMVSMLENKKSNTYFDFYIMTSGDIGFEKNYINKLNTLYPNDCKINIIDMKKRFSSSFIAPGHITTPTYYRLALPSLLTQYNKVLYLDGDILVRTDLSDLYNTDISGYYIGAVKDFGEILWTLPGGWFPDYAKRLGIRDGNQLINAGILVMNLKKMRDENLEKAFYGYIPKLKQRGILLNDQDVLNATCYDKIKFLSPTYNAMQHFGFNYDIIPHLFTCYDPYEFKEACENPKIVHFTSPNKPWKNSNMRFYGEWNKYRQIVENRIYKILPEGVYIIHSLLNDRKVLDICNADIASGANLQLWDLNWTNAQKFRLKYLEQGFYEIESLCSGKLVDVAWGGKSEGTNIWQWERNHTDAQKWKIINAGNGYFYIESRCSRLYIDVCNSNIANGSNVLSWVFHGGNNQKFRFEKV